jgi:hypothetical protein
MNKRLTLLLALPLAGYVSYALAQSTNVLGPSTTTVTATSVAATMAALGSNPSRKQVIICNGSATATATFTTGTLTPVNLTTGVVLQTGNVASSCFTLGTGGSGGPGVGAQINVIASTAGTPITFLEFY